MPQRTWLLKDEERGLDQRAWLVKRLKTDILQNTSRGRFGEYCRAVATEFEAQYPRDYRARIFKGPMKKRVCIREETAEEALKRTEGRYKQIIDWIHNHKDEILDELGVDKNPKPEYLKLQSYAQKPTHRARSARDIFIADNPLTIKNIDDAARTAGLTTQSERIAFRNEQITQAMAKLTELERKSYEARSAQEKEDKRSQRQLSHASQDAPASEPDRRQTLLDLEFTLGSLVREMAQKTNVEIVVLMGGENENGETRKYLFGSGGRSGSSEDFTVVIRNAASPAHSILSEFDNYLLRTRPDHVTLEPSASQDNSDLPVEDLAGAATLDDCRKSSPVPHTTDDRRLDGGVTIGPIQPAGTIGPDSEQLLPPSPTPSITIADSVDTPQSVELPVLPEIAIPSSSSPPVSTVAAIQDSNAAETPPKDLLQDTCTGCQGEDGLRRTSDSDDTTPGEGLIHQSHNECHTPKVTLRSKRQHEEHRVHSEGEPPLRKSARTKAVAGVKAATLALASSRRRPVARSDLTEGPCTTSDKRARKRIRRSEL